MAAKVAAEAAADDEMATEAAEGDETLRKSISLTVRPPLGAAQRSDRYCTTRGSAH